MHMGGTWRKRLREVKIESWSVVQGRQWRVSCFCSCVKADLGPRTSCHLRTFMESCEAQEVGPALILLTSKGMVCSGTPSPRAESLLAQVTVSAGSATAAFPWSTCVQPRTVLSSVQWGKGAASSELLGLRGEEACAGTGAPGPAHSERSSATVDDQSPSFRSLGR